LFVFFWLGEAEKFFALQEGRSVVEINDQEMENLNLQTKRISNLISFSVGQEKIKEFLKKENNSLFGRLKKIKTNNNLIIFKNGNGNMIYIN